MRSLALLLLATVTGCWWSASAPTSTLFPAAQAFQASFVAALEKRGELEVVQEGSGGSAGNSRTVDSVYRIRSTALAPDDLSSIVDKAAWYDAALSGYGTKGAGGGGNHYSVHFGDHDSQAFVDLLAFPDGEFTKVMVLLRVQE